LKKKQNRNIKKNNYREKRNSNQEWTVQRESKNMEPDTKWRQTKQTNTTQQRKHRSRKVL